MTLTVEYLRKPEISHEAPIENEPTPTKEAILSEGGTAEHNDLLSDS